MPVIPLLPLFHRFNSQYFENSLTVNNHPLVKVRWSDNRLKTTAGFYKRKRINGFIDSEIILSKPILSKLSTSEINSTFCLLYTSPSPRDPKTSRMPSSA